MIKKFLSILLVTTLILTCFSGCADKKAPASGSSSADQSEQPGSEDSDRLTIVATLFPQYDFARELAGDKADISLLLPPGMESHSYEPTPGDIITIQNSDVFLYTGDDMEPWVSGIVENLGDTPYVANLSEGIPLKKDMAHEHEEEQAYCHSDHEHDEHCIPEPEDHGGHCHSDHEHDEHCIPEPEDHGHCHSDHEHDEHCIPEPEDHGHHFASGHHHHHLYNPHIWTDPVLAIQMVKNIETALVKADPANKDYYEQRSADYQAELKELDQEFRDIVSSARQDTVYIGSRFSLLYFMDEYGLSYKAAYDSCEEEAEPSIKRVTSMIDEMRDKNVKAVYYEELTEPYIARTIAEAVGAKPLLFHSCHNVSRDELESGATYLSLMKQNAINLKKGLE